MRWRAPKYRDFSVRKISIFYTTFDCRAMCITRSFHDFGSTYIYVTVYLNLYQSAIVQTAEPDRSPRIPDR